MRCLDYYILAIDNPEWAIPWAGLGAILLGLGSALSGVAAVMTARNRGRDEAHNPDGDGTSAGDRSGLSGSSATSERAGGTNANGDN